MYRYGAALAAFLFLSAGCGSSGDVNVISGQSAGPVLMESGTANLFVQGPPVAGQVTVQNAAGQTLAQGPALAGVASFKLPENFFADASLRAQGGSGILVTFLVEEAEHLNAGGGPATFRAVVPDPVMYDVVGVDPVSAMIATHHLDHDLPLESAARDVYNYLDLPLDTDPEHLFQDTPFEASLFYQHARQAGGIDRLLSQVETEIDQQQNSSQRFLVNDGAKGILDTLAEQLQSSALEFVGGQVVSHAAGWLQGLIGFPADPTIQDVLDAIDGLRADIARLSTQIENVARTQAYITKDAPLATLRAEVSSDNDTLAQWASPTNQARPTQAALTKKMDEIHLKYNAALATAVQAELPSDGASGKDPGLIAMYLEGTVPRLYSATTVERAMYHLSRALELQQLILNLQVESFHFQVPAELYEAELAIDTYFANAKLQRQQYPLPFDMENLLLDRGTGLLWTRRPVILDDWRKIPDLVRNYTLGNTPAGQWRLPTVAELDTLVSATGGTGIDQHTEIGMKRDGFLPINGASEIGDWGIQPLNHLVLAGPIDYFSPTLGRATMVHVSNFRHSFENLGDYDGRFDRVIPFKLAFYLVRNAPTVESLTVSETGRTATTISYKAMARLSDGSQRDLTNLVRWKALNRSGVAVSHDVARISNASKDDGRLTLRVSGAADLKVVATYQSVEGSLAVPTVTFAAPPITNIVISPVRYEVAADKYPFQLAYHARTVRANGQVADADTQVTWSSSDPTVQVSASGLVQAVRPASRKTVQIKATLGSVSQTATLVLDP
jgi:hypothetical protein